MEGGAGGAGELKGVVGEAGNCSWKGELVGNWRRNGEESCEGGGTGGKAENRSLKRELDWELEGGT